MWINIKVISTRAMFVVAIPVDDNIASPLPKFVKPLTYYIKEVFPTLMSGTLDIKHMLTDTLLSNEFPTGEAHSRGLHNRRRVNGAVLYTQSKIKDYTQKMQMVTEMLNRALSGIKDVSVPDTELAQMDTGSPIHLPLHISSSERGSSEVGIEEVIWDEIPDHPNASATDVDAPSPPAPDSNVLAGIEESKVELTSIRHGLSPMAIAFLTANPTTLLRM